MQSLTNSALIIPGRLASDDHQNHLNGVLKAAGVSLVSRRNIAWLKQSNKTTLLRQVKIIIRASGRKMRHLARYLVGVGENGTRYEVFLEVVQGVQGAAFGLGVAAQRGLLRLAAVVFGGGLSARQRVAAVC